MEFNVNPYYDDFMDENGPRENNYMRILFKPGFAVQARELTQIQSILQNQLKEFGDHIFKDGSPVRGGHLSLDTKVPYVKLNPQYNSLDINLDSFSNSLVYKVGDSTKVAKVIATDESQPYPTLLLKYLSGEFAAGETVRETSYSNTATLIASSATGYGSTVSINEGIFYVDGYFVYVEPQTIVLDSYGTTPTYRIGLEISDGFVTVSEDSTLSDPAQGSFNYQAPGADRYQVSLNLTKRSLDSKDDSQFFELLRVENGVITKQVTYPIYSELEKTLARRTFDESGSYTVTPFKATAAANTSDTSKFNLEVSAGKAYVKGYEFETINTTRYSVNKARTTDTSTDYDLSVEYGNYIVVTDLFGGSTNGMIDTGVYGSLDLHVVPVASINSANSSAYSNTKIGTARVRTVTRKDEDSFYVHLLDINTSPKVVYAENNTDASALVLPNTFSQLANAYSDVEFTVLSGPGVGQSRTITTYDNYTARFTPPLTVAANSQSLISLNYGVKDIDSLVETLASEDATAYTSHKLVSMNIDTLSGKTVAGRTKLEATNLDRMVFPLPEMYVSRGNFNNVQYFHRKLLRNRTFTSGALTIGTGSGLDTPQESFYYGTDGQNLSTTAANTNILVLVKSPGGSGFTSGQILNLTSGGASVQRVSDQQITINSGQGNSFTADVFVNVKVDDVENNYRRSKTLRGNSALSLTVTDTYTNGTAVTGKSSAYLDTTRGHVWFTSASDIVKTPGERQSLYIADVIKVYKVYDSGNTSWAPNTTNAVDITNNYLFDSGQNDNYYDHASLILKDSAAPPRGQTVVMFEYFEHSNDSGMFSADSYSAAVYEQNKIPYYNSRTLGSFSLRDAIDFRPTRQAGTTAYTIGGLKIQNPDLPITLTYAFYLPRIDKLVATQDKEFKVITGIPAYVPREPKDSDDAMTLYTMYIPPYTFDTKDIKFRYFENKRYTMRDIGSLEKRIEQVEYYTALSLLESKARSQSVLYEDGVLEKEKYGIVVDQFDGFNIADNKNPDLVCNLSFNELKPYKLINTVNFEYSSYSGQPYKKNDKTYSLTFTETPAISQNTATKAISVQPYLFAQFVGKLTLRPESDHWFSTVITPEVTAPPGDTVTTSTPPVEQPVTPTTGSVTPTTVNSGTTFGGNGQMFNFTYAGFGFLDWTSFWAGGPAPWNVPTNMVNQSVISPDTSSTILAQSGPNIDWGMGRFESARALN